MTERRALSFAILKCLSDPVILYSDGPLRNMLYLLRSHLYGMHSNNMVMKRILDLLFRDLAVAIMPFHGPKILCGTCVCEQMANNISAICNFDTLILQIT
jgi:hypothetical protein